MSRFTWFLLWVFFKALCQESISLTCGPFPAVISDVNPLIPCLLRPHSGKKQAPHRCRRTVLTCTQGQANHCEFEQAGNALELISSLLLCLPPEALCRVRSSFKDTGAGTETRGQREHWSFFSHLDLYSAYPILAPGETGKGFE